MSGPDSKLWIFDLDEAITVLSELEGLIDKSVKVTGCTDLLCSAMIDVFYQMERDA